MRAPRELLSRLVEASLERFRQRGRRSVAWMVRLTAVAVASYVVANLFFPSSVPLLAPLTALLVVQLTPVSILASGIQRVIAVVVGVSVAVGFSSLVHITWWSLGTVIAVSLLIGQLLRLGPNLIEVPISAMLVLGVGSRTTGTAAWQRIAETLVGASVGVLANLLFPPKVTTEDAATAIERLGASLAKVLEAAASEATAEGLTTHDLGERAGRWLADARRITHDIPNVGNALVRAEESRRLNLRALGTANSGPGLRHGLESLEHSALAVRSMFRTVVDTTRAYEAEDRELAEEVRTILGLVLHSLGGVVASFARLVRTDARVGDDAPQRAALRDALQRLQKAHARVRHELLTDVGSDTTLATLTISVLTTVQRLLQEMSVDDLAQLDLRPALTRARRLAPHPRRRPQAGPAREAWRRRR